MNKEMQVGVWMPGVLELARQVLIGVRSWCDEHPHVRMNILNEYGDMSNHDFTIKPMDIPYMGTVCFFQHPKLIEYFTQLSPHIISISNRYAENPYSKVINDDEAVGRLGVDYFYKRGYRSIVFFGMPEMKFSELRQRGYEHRIQELGLTPHIFTQDQMNVMEEELLAIDVRVAVLCAADNLARTFLCTLEDPLQSVPTPLAVLGVDDDSLQNALSPVNLSSIRLSGEQLGYRAADLVHRAYHGEKLPKTPVKIAPQTVMTRRSTNALAVTDPLIRKVLKLIHSQVSSYPDVGTLLQDVSVSRRSLENRFKEVTGRSLLTELTDARIDKARELLTSTQLSMKEIADVLGLNDQRQFSLIYKRVTHETPTEYRQRVQLGK